MIIILIKKIFIIKVLFSSYLKEKLNIIKKIIELLLYEFLKIACFSLRS